jgi:Outer membrane lipoprotein-sorting protein
MRQLRACIALMGVWAAVAGSVTWAQVGAGSAADKTLVLTKTRQRIEATDFRATGHLVKVSGSGQRTNYKLSMKGHWFADGLRILFEVTDPVPSRMKALLHMGTGGHTTIELVKAGTTTATLLPFERWDESLLGTDFSLEDILEPQYFWKGQDLEDEAKCGARDCFILKSVPGADDRSHYTSVVSSIDRTIFYPVTVVKTEAGSGARKEFSSEGLRETSGVWSASQVEVKVSGKTGSSLLVIERGSAKARLTLKDFDFNQPPVHGEE